MLDPILGASSAVTKQPAQSPPHPQPTSPPFLTTPTDSLIKPLVEALRTSSPTLQPAEQAATPTPRQRVFFWLYFISKVRGPKTVVKHFTHEVSDFHKVLAELRAQDPADNAAWTTRYILLLWMSLIAMIPFDMSILDAVAREAGESIPNQIFALCTVRRDLPPKQMSQTAPPWSL